MRKLYVNYIEINGKEQVELKFIEQIDNIISKIKNGFINEIIFYLDDSNMMLNIFQREINFI